MGQVRDIVLGVIASVSPFSEEKLSLDALMDAPMAGKGSKIDSFTLVNLIFSIEDRIHDEMGVAIEITAEKALSLSRSPFRTPRTLIDYISNDLLAGAKAS